MACTGPVNTQSRLLVQKFLVANYEPIKGICGKIFNNLMINLPARSIITEKRCVVNLT